MNTGDHIVLRGVSPGSNPTRPQGGCEIAPAPGRARTSVLCSDAQGRQRGPNA